VLVKAGQDVLVPCAGRSRERTWGVARSVEREFLTLDERERSVRSWLAKNGGHLSGAGESAQCPMNRTTTMRPQLTMSQEVGAKAARKLRRAAMPRRESGLDWG